MLNKIINLKPQVTEKAFALAGQGKYTFVVENNANKHIVAETIEKLFKVKVTAVNILNIPGKVKRTRRGVGTRKDYQKAVVTLKKGDKIDIFETEEEKKDTKKDKSKIKDQKSKSETEKE